MPATAEEFRRRARTTVKLPSGLEVEIRKLHLWDFDGLTEIPLPSGSADQIDGEDESTAVQSPEERAEVRKYTVRAIVKASIKPRFTDKEDPDPDLINVEDLDDNDFQALAEGILEWMTKGKDKTETEGNKNG